MNKINILFVSSLCSSKKYKWVCSIRTKQSLDPAQRFFSAITKGFYKNDCTVTCLTALPIGTSNTDRIKFERDEEEINEIKYVYLGFRVGVLKRMIDLRRNTEIEVKSWMKKTAGTNRVVICDSLLFMCTRIARKVAQKNGIKAYAYVTDYPSLATLIKGKKGFLSGLMQMCFDKAANHDLKKYDGYILVAEKLIDLIGVKNKPYIVVEDAIDIPNDEIIPCNEQREYHEIVYGGALCERFGINKLVDAVRLIKDKNVVLKLYGSGESVFYIEKAASTDHSIRYCGLVSFDELQEIQRKADLLINPRPSNETFSAYSFPSKTLSYMLTGTPVLSTRIPGIPMDYEPYIYWFDAEDVESMSKKIQNILSIPRLELCTKGKEAYEYVVREKNGNAQAQKIVDFCRGN